MSRDSKSAARSHNDRPRRGFALRSHIELTVSVRLQVHNRFSLARCARAKNAELQQTGFIVSHSMARLNPWPPSCDMHGQVVSAVVKAVAGLIWMAMKVIVHRRGVGWRNALPSSLSSSCAARPSLKHSDTQDGAVANVASA